MKKKFLCCICVLSIALLCACGRGTDRAGGTLTICADGNGMNEMFLGPILAEFERQNPEVLAMASRYYLLKTGSLSPVSVENAGIQINMAQWQELIKLNRNLIETCGYSEEDGRKSLEGYEQHIEDGAAVLPGLSSQAEYYLRVLEDSGHTMRLLPIPNENGGITMMPHITAAVSAGCENTNAAASLLLFLLGETVQGRGELEQSGGNASLFITGNSWPVRKGCGVKMLEHIKLYPVKYGTVSDMLEADVEKMENRIDTCRLASGYDGELPELLAPYLDGEQTWEECYANIEREWSYLDE